MSEKEIKEILVKLQEGYIKRDISLIDKYANSLISKDHGVFAVGTGDNEWCFGWEEVRELIQSDWEYWGDFSIDLGNIVISFYEDITWFITPATVAYEFETSDERYERYLEAVKSHIDENSEWNDLSNLSKITNVNYLLSSLMGNRKEEKRRYKWPARFSGVLVKEEGQWLFQYMKFSMVNPSKYPDIRFNNKEEYEESFKELKDKMVTFKESNISLDTKEIEERIREFQNIYLNEDCSTEDILINFFDTDKNISLIGTDETLGRDKIEVEEVIKQNRMKWSKIELDIEEMVINKKNNIAWFATNGIVEKNMSIEEACTQEIKSLIDIFYKDIPPRDKVFKIQRDISVLMKEISKGEDFIWPIRLEGIMIKRNDKWLIHTLQFSYPFKMILEGKYD